jgi:hypothetical protein
MPASKYGMKRKTKKKAMPKPKKMRKVRRSY